MKQLILLIPALFIFYCHSVHAQKIPDYQRSLQTYNDKPIHTVSKGNISVLDFGKAYFGKLKIEVTSLTVGDTLIVRLGEKFLNGRIDQKPGGNIRYLADTVVKTANTPDVLYFPLRQDTKNTSGRAILLPEYMGAILPFRAAELQTAKPVKLNAERLYYHLPFDDKAAYIKTSNTLLDSILQLCTHTVKATTFSGLYVDGDRERIPYEADALINQLSHYVVDTTSYAIAQHTIDYLMKSPSWPTEWHLQMHQLVWNDYLYTGETRIMLDYYELLAKKTLAAFTYQDDLISTTAVKQSPEFLQSIHYNTFDRKEVLKDITDWPQRGNSLAGPDYKGEADEFVFCDINSVVNAYYYRSLVLMGEFARILGKTADQRFYEEKSAKVKTAFRNQFWDPTLQLFTDGNCSKHTSLHANAFALAFGLAEKTDIPSIVPFLKKKGMACSVYGVQFLFEALMKEGETNHVLQLITDRGMRSWHQMLQSGATMTAEAWDIRFKPNLDWNHAWGTAPLNIMVREIMGLKALSPEKIAIRPKPGALENIDARIPFRKGSIRYSLQQTQKQVVVEIEITGSLFAEFLGDSWLGGHIQYKGQQWKTTDAITLKKGRHRLVIKN